MKRIVPALGVLLALASSSFAQHRAVSHMVNRSSHKTRVFRTQKIIYKHSVYQGRPAGAIALCWDGTYSYAANRRETCSWHGGVRQWFR
jgi:hypothetical protein